MYIVITFMHFTVKYCVLHHIKQYHFGLYANFFYNLWRTRKFLQQMTIINICSKLKTFYKLEKCPNFWNFWTLFVTLVSRGPSIIRLSKLIFPHKELHYCFIYFGRNKLKCDGFSISELQHWALLPLHCTIFWE